jgi:hypothetical protein
MRRSATNLHTFRVSGDLGRVSGAVAMVFGA